MWMWFVIRDERKRRVDLEKRYLESQEKFVEKLNSVHEKYLEHIKELEHQVISRAVSKDGSEYRETLAVHERTPNQIEEGQPNHREISSLGDLPEGALEDINLVAQDN